MAVTQPAWPSSVPRRERVSDILFFVVEVAGVEKRGEGCFKDGFEREKATTIEVSEKSFQRDPSSSFDGLPNSKTGGVAFDREHRWQEAPRAAKAGRRRERERGGPQQQPSSSIERRPQRQSAQLERLSPSCALAVSLICDNTTRIAASESLVLAQVRNEGGEQEPAAERRYFGLVASERPPPPSRSPSEKLLLRFSQSSLRARSPDFLRERMKTMRARSRNRREREKRNEKQLQGHPGESVPYGKKL